MFEGDVRRISEPAIEASQEFSRRCAGPGPKREAFRGVVLDTLRAIERLIVTRLKAGEVHDELVATNWFGKEISHVEERKVAPAPLAVGFLRCLPDGHPLHTLGRHFIAGDKREPAVVLGLVVRGVPRPFFTTAACRRWTSAMVALQDDSLSHRPVWNMTDEEVARLRSDQAQRQKLPPRASRSPISYGDGVQRIPVNWKERVSLVLRTLPRPEISFKDPPDSATLPDLYTARHRLINAIPPDFEGMAEDPPHVDPADDGAYRLASKYGGPTRRQEIHNALLTMIVEMDRMIQHELDDAIAWTARNRAAIEALLQTRK